MQAIKTLLPLAILLALPTAQAAEQYNFYTGARIGATDINVDATKTGALDSNDLGAGLFLGYQATNNLAFELGYNYLGKYDLNNGNGDIKAQSIDLVGKLSTNLAPKLNGYLKAGVAHVMADVSGATNYNENSLVPTVGAGLEYFFNPQWSSALEYQYYNDIDLKTSDMNLSFYGINFSYHFGAKDEPMMTQEVITTEIADLKVSLPFGFDKTTLTPAAKAQLDPVIARLELDPNYELYIEGNTDSRGSKVYNQALSEHRAQTVANTIKASYDVDEARVVVKGYGETNPVASNKTEEGRAANRRVDVSVPGIETSEVMETEVK